MSLDPQVIRRAVARDPAAVRAMVAALGPILHRRVARMLVRRRAAADGRPLRQEVEDLVQEVFCGLLADDGRRLLAWDPSKGSAETFFGLLAERLASNVMRSRRGPWQERPLPPEELDRVDRGSDLERRLDSRSDLRALAARLRANLSERDRALFTLIYVQGRTPAEAAELLGLERDVLYQATRRLRHKVRAEAEALLSPAQEVAS